MKPEEQRALAIDCGAVANIRTHTNTAGDSIVFIPEELAVYTAAVEAKVLEEAEERCISLPASSDTVMDCSEVLCRMIELRK